MGIIHKLHQKFADALLDASGDVHVDEFIEKSCDLLEAITAFSSFSRYRLRSEILICKVVKRNQFMPLMINLQKLQVESLMLSKKLTLLVLFHFFRLFIHSGIPYLLGCLLLQQGPLRNVNTVPEISNSFLNIVHVCINIINNVASLSLVLLQVFCIIYLFYITRPLTLLVGIGSR
jgi:hypothetical protein